MTRDVNEVPWGGTWQQGGAGSVYWAVWNLRECVLGGLIRYGRMKLLPVKRIVHCIVFALYLGVLFNTVEYYIREYI